MHGSRCAIRSLPAQVSGRPSWRAATARSMRSRSCWSGSRAGDPSAAWCSPVCAGSARPSCSASCARWRSGRAGGRARSRRGPRRTCAVRCRPRCTAPSATSPSGTRPRTASTRSLGVLKAFALRDRPRTAPSCATAGSPASTSPSRSGRADSGDIEIDLVELFTEVAALAATSAPAWRSSSTRCRTCARTTSRALCAACHELSQPGAPLVVVGAGLPHLPAVLSASKSYSERLFRYPGSTSSTARTPTSPCSRRPSGRTRRSTPRRWTRCSTASGGYPYFVQAYGKAAWDAAVRSPITAADVKMAAPEAEAELAVGFFGSRFERATPAEREYLRAMAELTEGRDEPVGTSGVADHLRRRARRCRRPGTACSRRVSSSPRSAARSPSPCRTSAAICSRQEPDRPPIG